MARKYPPEKIFIALVTVVSIVTYLLWLLFLLVLTVWGFALPLWDGTYSQSNVWDITFFEFAGVFSHAVLMPVLGILGMAGGLATFTNYAAIKNEYTSKSKEALFLIGCGVVACFMHFIFILTGVSFLSVSSNELFFSFMAIFPAFLAIYGLYGMVCIYRVKNK